MCQYQKEVDYLVISELIYKRIDFIDSPLG